MQSQQIIGHFISHWKNPYLLTWEGGHCALLRKQGLKERKEVTINAGRFVFFLLGFKLNIGKLIANRTGKIM